MPIATGIDFLILSEVETTITNEGLWPLSRKVQIHSAPSLLVKLGSDVAARGEPPRFTPLCRKAMMLHAASLDGAVCYIRGETKYVGSPTPARNP